MKIKDGVNIQGIDIRIRPVLIAADSLWRKYGHELVVTGGLDGTHSAGSLHYYGLALDLRTRYFEPGIAKEIVNRLLNILGPNFDVVLHKSHIHIEYDKRE